MARYVTRTGRALSPGRVTRSSHLVRTRQRKQEKPLPAELMCHPKKLSPTPHHPSCATYTSFDGLGINMANHWTREDFYNGKHLDKNNGRYALSNDRGCFGFHDDVRFAMAWKFAAKIHGIDVEILDGG